MDRKFDLLQTAMNSSLRWSIGAILGVGAAVLAAIFTVH